MSDPRTNHGAALMMIADQNRTIADYEEVLADHARLVRELDVLLNGEAGAAKQASLCDLVAQVARIKRATNEAAVTTPRESVAK